jgi:hypothetical protein
VQANLSLIRVDVQISWRISSELVSELLWSAILAGLKPIDYVGRVSIEVYGRRKFTVKGVWR